jgi:hypothetical protein
MITAVRSQAAGSAAASGQAVGLVFTIEPPPLHRIDGACFYFDDCCWVVVCPVTAATGAAVLPAGRPEMVLRAERTRYGRPGQHHPGLRGHARG